MVNWSPKRLDCCSPRKRKMSAMESLVVLLSSSLCLFLLQILVKFLYRVWWTPIRVQHLMRSQGIVGPSYRFLYGTNDQLLKMRTEALSRPMTDLSHNIYPRIQPHLYLWINKYGTNFLQWFGPQPQLVMSEPDLIKEVLTNKDRIYRKPPVQGYSKKILGNGLFTSQGEKWSKMRKLANYAFHGESLKNMIPEMVASVEMMLESWDKYHGKEIEVFEEFRRLTSEVISRTAFGSSYLEGQNIFDMISKLAVITQRNSFKFRIPGIGKILRYGDEFEAEELEKGIHNSILKLFKKREERVMSGESDSYGNDFFGLLINTYHDDDESKKISVEDLVDECKTFYFGGQETTNTLLSWTVLLLAIHTDWQEEARNEILKILGQQTPNAEGIAKLKIMSMIINETLRLYPPVLSLHRQVSKEIRLGKLTLPANMYLLLSILALHHDPNIWGEDVHLFKPERFSEGVAKAADGNSAAYLPFGAGPRICVGFNFATIEAKIALCMILQRYSFRLSPAYVHSPFQLLTVRPQYGVQVILNAL
ncbi:hypothetical protein K2173_027084 [Erythroxylum novogranatense]|uniref:Cytochrome P450 n=1 Tax=Erythroxylum novogranatense TaxID=1862640 RepID=A0AAV8TY06_9ROSI|nr:hypothetical protein K2173_027084 [Erythroxylum novogranatense]